MNPGSGGFDYPTGGGGGGGNFNSNNPYNSNNNNPPPVGYYGNSSSSCHYGVPNTGSGGGGAHHQYGYNNNTVVTPNYGEPYYPPGDIYVGAEGSYSGWGDTNNSMIPQPPPLPTTTTNEVIVGGTFYEVNTIENPLGTSIPISALAYDKTYNALYSATVTVSSNKRYAARDAIVMTHQLVNDQNNNNNMMLLYASVATHPEAPSNVMSLIYSSIYGYGSSSITSPMIPSHAYQPPYGKTEPALPDMALGKGNFHMGITKLIPIQNGHVLSFSPSGIRIQTIGGAPVTDYELYGTLSGTPHSDSSNNNNNLTHVMVGGIHIQQQQQKHQQQQQQQSSSIRCLDVWQGLRTVSIFSMEENVTVTSMATSYVRNCVIAGCSDGTIRLIDSRNRNCLAKIKSHMGGVVNIAASTTTNNAALVATVGYGSRGCGRPPLFAYPDPTILINDIRYLGRGGFPHPFAGIRGGPRYIEFIPEINIGQQTSSNNRLLVASGQVGGGCQIIIPFQQHTTVSDSNNFFIPHLGRGESINCMTITDENLAFGTSHGKIMQYRMAGYQHNKASNNNLSNEALFSGTTTSRRGVFVPSTTTRANSAVSKIHNNTTKKLHLVTPSFDVQPPHVSIDASILLNNDERNGIIKMKTGFDSYTLTVDPNVSAIGDNNNNNTRNNRSHIMSSSSFLQLATSPLIHQCKMQISDELLKKSSQKTIDFVCTIPASDLKIDIFDDHRSSRIKNREKEKTATVVESLKNPNKFVYSNKLFKTCYEDSLNRNRRFGKQGRHREGGSNRFGGSDSDDEGDTISIPNRYRLTLRPTHILAATFNHTEFNQTGTIPGYDYSMTMPNAFVPPVLLLLYFIPEVREVAMKSQLGQSGLLMELGCLFQRIESLSRFAFLFTNETGSFSKACIEAWSPSSLISLLSTMPEAERVQVLDGSPAAVDTPRRPEAFYRFLLYQLDKEIDQGRSSGLLDSLGGANFLSINEFVSGSGPPSQSMTRQLTVELSYDKFLDQSKKDCTMPTFGEFLQSNLSRETRLRAWNTTSKSYETIVQRKIITSLPTILSLSAACAGRKEGEGLAFWRGKGNDNNHWLPEMIEIEIAEDRSVITRELVRNPQSDSEEWKEYRGTGPLPSSISDVVKGATKSKGPQKRKYRLDFVVSMVRDDLDRNCPEEIRALNEQGTFGHHVLHVRMPKQLKKRILQKQLDEVKKYQRQAHVSGISDMTILGRSIDANIIQKRVEYAEARLNKVNDDESSPDSDWILINGFVVSNTVVEDARAFHVGFKEPSLVIFRAVDDYSEKPKLRKKSSSRSSDGESPELKIPPELMRTASITNNSKSPYTANQRASALPGEGDLIAFDAEFVAVEEEQSTLTLAGTKVTIRETRHAVARISIIDGRPNRAGAVIVDDHVQPNEEVKDYLTRFSGIVADDLSPKRSRHHLIPARAAYMKLRCLIERGCIFVGHGLQQDFWTANLAVSAAQIIDTVDIYHKPAQRYVSLRFLTNFVLNRDMQQDVHDSVEDALAAFELYQKAVELKEQGEFDKILNDLYEYGQKTDWKLGIDENNG